MFLVHLWNYIRGYVIIIAKGKSVERFINICTRRQILLWDIVRRDSDSAIMKASLRGFLLMRPAAKKSGCRVNIEKKCGLPFFFHRFKKRRGFQVGLLFFAVLIVFFTSMIWDIEITGCSSLTAEQVMTILNSRHIGKGTFKMGLDPKGIAQEILLNIDDVAWAGVRIQGVKLSVAIENIVPKPTVIKENDFFNIVAERDGLVTGVEVFAGSAKVKEGETVKKGQILVSGTLESKNPEFGARDVHALGRIIARTWYDFKAPLSSEYIKRIRTGKTHENTYIRFLSYKIGLPGNHEPFKVFDSATYDKTLAGPFNTRLPAGLTIETLYEVTENVVRLTNEEAQALALEMARKALSASLPSDCKVVDEKVNFIKDETNGEMIELIYECEEDIAGLSP